MLIPCVSHDLYSIRNVKYLATLVAFDRCCRGKVARRLVGEFVHRELRGEETGERERMGRIA